MAGAAAIVPAGGVGALPIASIAVGGGTTTTTLAAGIAGAIGVETAVVAGALNAAASFMTLGLIGSLICSNTSACTAPQFQVFIRSRSSGKVLDVPGFATNDGAKIQQFTYNGGKNQQWQFVATGSLVGNMNVGKMVSVSSGKVLDVPGFATNNGAQIDQWTDNGGQNQRWVLTRVEGEADFVTILSESSGKLLEVPDFATNDGTLIDQFADNGGRNQHWRLVPVV
jgi:hypothetical protein